MPDNDLQKALAACRKADETGDPAHIEATYAEAYKVLKARNARRSDDELAAHLQRRGVHFRRDSRGIVLTRMLVAR
jgi:hypothetical protein